MGLGKEVSKRVLAVETRDWRLAGILDMMIEDLWLGLAVKAWTRATRLSQEEEMKRMLCIDLGEEWKKERFFGGK